MIYITGDIHGNPFARLSMAAFPEQKEMTKKDYVIICGDFGLVWDYSGESAKEKNALDWLNNKPFTTLFVDGNHECHPRLRKYPVQTWNSGKVHVLRPSIFHLMRGEFFDILGTRIFAFGGAKSHDIDHLLDPDDPNYQREKRQLIRENLFFREVGKTWWPEENPSNVEMSHGFSVLEDHGWDVDYIISHDCPASTLHLLYTCAQTDDLNEFFDLIRSKTDYKRWFFGHYHENKAVNEKEICLYEQIVRIA